MPQSPCKSQGVQTAGGKRGYTCAFKNVHHHDHECHWATHRRLDSIHMHKYPRKCVGGWLLHLLNGRTCKHNAEDEGSAPNCLFVQFHVLYYFHVSTKKKIGFPVCCFCVIATNKKSSPSFHFTSCSCAFSCILCTTIAEACFASPSSKS